MAGSHYNGLEVRNPDVREQDLFGQLPNLLALALSAPGWARHLGRIDPNAITSRAELAQLPVIRSSDFKKLQRDFPPFGGLNVTMPSRAHRLLMFPGGILRPETSGKDCWGAARALFAAGFRPGDVVYNSFAYHRAPEGYMFESGAHALNCAVVTSSVSDIKQRLDAIARFRPAGFVGAIDVLESLLDAAPIAGVDTSSIARALLCGAAPSPAQRLHLSERRIAVRQCYANVDIGVIAYETDALEGMVVNESLLVEIVRPGTGTPVADGEVGEIVVTSFNPDYPMIRLATGDLSAVLKGRSSCGRTNMRIRHVVKRSPAFA